MIRDSRYVRALTQQRHAEAIRLLRSGDRRAIKAFLASARSSIAEDVGGMVEALRNVTLASSFLRDLGSKGLRGIDYPRYGALVKYHSTVALHESGVFRNRVARVVKHLEKHARESNDAYLIAWLRDQKVYILAPDPIRKMRHEHVHERTFVPEAISQYPAYYKAASSPSERARLTRIMKATVLEYSRGWRSMAKIDEAWAVLLLDVTHLIGSPISQADDRAELDRLAAIVKRMQKAL